MGYEKMGGEGGDGAARGLTQLRVFGRKNFVLARRNWKGTLGQLVSPFVIIAMLYGLQLLANGILDVANPNPQPTIIGTYPKCQERNVPCKTIAYAPSDVPWVKNVMRELAAKSGLDYETTFMEFNNSMDDPISKLLKDNSTLYTFLMNNPNATQHALIFTSAYFNSYNETTPPADVGYILFFNGTLTYNFALELMRVLDESVMQLKTSTNITISAELNEYPTPTPRVAGYDAVAANGGVWFYVPPMITFFILLTEIVMEKEQRLRLGMRMMGLMDSVYWTIWFFTGLAFIALSTIVLFISGLIFRFDFFTNSNFFAVFFMFLCFGIATNALAFFLSTLVNTAKTAQTMGYAIILVGFVFQIILCSAYGMLIEMLYAEEVAQWVKAIRWVLTFYPPFNLALAFNNVAALSSNVINLSTRTITKGPGYFWSSLTETRYAYFSFSEPLHVYIPGNSTIYGYMIMNAVIFLVLALYLDNVVPGDHGAPKPFWFFLTKRYWGLHEKRNNKDALSMPSNSTVNVDPDVKEEGRKAATALMANSPTGVQVLNLTKVYPHSIFYKSNKDTKAVEDLNLCADEGDILCILGHNGAGKTTTINMLVGLFPPTSGIGMIYGKDVAAETAQIQRFMGVCPQHDILWNELTAREHLEIFARLKGVAKDKVTSEVDDKLTMVGLIDVGNDRVGTYSGGMKRRLSVAIASIGEPKIIFLDEPTTGMDPVNRRSVWELIQKMKMGRVIILTTHSMEEADILGDKIAIMAHGNLCAVGNSLHLKNRFGTGYRVNVTVSEMRNKKLVETEMQRIVPDAKVLANNARNLTIGIPLTSRDKMEPCLKYLEAKSGEDRNVQNQAKPVVKEWGLSHTTLEDVFLEVTKRENFTYPEDANGHVDENESRPKMADSVEVTTETDLARFGANRDEVTKRSSYAFRALLRKNFSLQKKQTGTNCCQIVTPILVMLILVVLQIIVRSQLGSSDTSISISTLPFPINTGGQLPFSINPGFTTNQHVPSSPPPPSHFPSLDDILFKMKDPRSPIFTNLANEFSEFVTPSLRSIYEPAWTFAADPTLPPSPIGNLTNNTLPQCLEFFWFTQPPTGDQVGNLPRDKSSNKSGLLGLIPQRSCLLFNGTRVNVPYYVEQPNPQTMMSDLYTILEDYNVIPIADLDYGPVNYPLPDGTAEFKEYDPTGHISYTMSVNDGRITNYHRPNNFSRTGFEQKNGQYSQGSLLIVPGRLSLMSMIHDAMTKALTNIDVSILNTKFVQLMPYKDNQDIAGLLEIFGSFLYPIALALQLPVYLYILVLEKADRLREMMGMHGLPKWTYYLSHYIFCLILYILVITFFYICGAIAQIRFFSQTSFFTLALFFFMWGNSLISLSMILSTFINSKRASVVVGYLVALMGSLIGIVICIGIYADTTKKIPTGYLIWPQFAFIRGLYLLNNACAINYQCYGPLSTISGSDEYVSCIIAMFLDAIVYYIIYLYLDVVMPREFGVPKHPLFFLGRFMPKKIARKDDEKTALLDQAKPTKTFHDNPDVGQEKQRVMRKEYARGSPLVLDNLSKKYPGSEKYSLQGLYLSVEAGECFSLLGENGAGKSTTISLLTGLYPPTYGTALIAGHDILTEMDQGRLTLGVCPQFNVLWDTLTVEEHLLFYARLKGVSPKEEKHHVQNWLVELGLTFAAQRPSASLSGGMKRRVSIGIALVGNPKVVFLDEPTTGLDPASRRQLWTIVERARTGRALILTTHSMDEAEVLSNRIGIMALGTMRCIGTPQHLKNSIGNLFHLKLNFAPENLTLAENYAYSLFPNAQLIRSYKGTSEFHIPQGTLMVSEVFAKMEASSADNGILDWSFSQVGLEEVFQMVVEDSHKNK